MSPEAGAVFAKAGIALADADLYRVAEVYNFWEQKGEGIWPGMQISSTPVQLVFPEKYGVLIGHPEPPKDCEAQETLLPVLDRPFCLRPDRSFMYGAGTGALNKRPVVSLNTLGVFDAYVNEQLKKQKPDAAKYAKPYLEYLGTLAHELTHAYQHSEKRNLPKKERDIKPIRSTKIDYPYQDAEACLLLGLEGRALSDLVDEDSAARATELWRDFLAARRARRARLPKGLPLIEQYMELSEGTAQYVGWAVMYGKNDDVRPLPQLLADERFTGYLSSDTVRSQVKQALAGLEHPARSRWMQYVYATGAALAYNLDKAAPGWKNGLFRRLSGFRSGLDSLLTENVGRSGKDKRRIETMCARYGCDAMRAVIDEALAKDLETNKVKLDVFYAAPGRRYRFEFRKTRPDGLLVYAPVLLTEYKDLRVFEAGITKIGYERGGKDNYVSFSKARPVLQDKAAGRFELALDEGDLPAITAARTLAKKGKTVYKGGVEVKSGVFSWKGDTLEVSESEGIVTLAF
ncbi:MAG: hypothetical protein A2X31_00865 [Elusimicrobia bacterium GWB2_63_22]|nr:MAG: hypothetical protein A2X31_00865 [Elusimicrobia bacterium GWB2_63_22]